MNLQNASRNESVDRLSHFDVNCSDGEAGKNKAVALNAGSALLCREGPEEINSNVRKWRLMSWSVFT